MITAERYHDISTGHRVVGHENKCRHLHGHNYRIHFKVAALDNLDSVGRVLDFGVIKTLLCQWLEDTWDHKMLIWEKDPMLPALQEISEDSIVITSFNPTAENMANYLLWRIAPSLLQETNTYLTEVKIEETRKCSASAKRMDKWK